jgi:hypothetical protein
MWRKGVLLQFLVFSLLLAGAAEARPAGSSGNLEIGHVDSGSEAGRSPRARLGFSATTQGIEGEAGSIINPDGVRSFGTIPTVLGHGKRGGLVRLAVDPHG